MAAGREGTYMGEFNLKDLEYTEDKESGEEWITALGKPACFLYFQSVVAEVYIALPDTKSGYFEKLKTKNFGYRSDGFYGISVSLSGIDKPSIDLHYIPLNEEQPPFLVTAGRPSDLYKPENEREGNFKNDPDPDYRLLWAALEEADKLVRKILPGYHLI